MSGTLEGGRKAAATNKAKYGKEFYANIGRKGGHNGHKGGFAAETVGKDGLTGPERAKLAGRKGGTISKRGPAKRGGRVISANYNEAQLARIREELGWNDDQAREDYKPTEPRIKDEKVRKCAKLWLEINEIYSVTYHKRRGGGSYLELDNMPMRNGCCIIFQDLIEELKDGQTYTATELCGEEEE